MGIEDDGFGTIYKNVSAAGGAGGSNGNRLVWQPGGVPGGAVYADWVALMDARDSIPGHVIIEIDDVVIRPTPPTIPDGDWDLSHTTLVGAPTYPTDVDRVEIATSSGTVFLGMPSFKNLTVRLHNSDPLYVAVTAFNFGLVNTYIEVDGGGALAFVSDSTVTVTMSDRSEFWNFNGFLFVLDNAHLECYLSNASLFHNGTVSDDTYRPSLLQTFFDGSCDVELNAQNVTAEIPNARSQALHVGVVLAPQYWNPAPDEVNSALDRIAALLTSLNGGDPIL